MPAGENADINSKFNPFDLSASLTCRITQLNPDPANEVKSSLLRGCPHIMSARLRDTQTPPLSSSIVSTCLTPLSHYKPLNPNKNNSWKDVLWFYIFSKTYKCPTAYQPTSVGSTIVKNWVLTYTLHTLPWPFWWLEGYHKTIFWNRWWTQWLLSS